MPGKRTVRDQEKLAPRAVDEKPDLVQAEPQILVKLAPDHMKAFLTLRPGLATEYPFSVEAILAALSNAGVVHGILRDRIEAMVDNEELAAEEVVAEGTYQTDAEDARIVYLFDPAPTAAPLDPDSKVNWREISQIQLVVKDQVLARKIPIKEGCDGLSVKGRPVRARRGVDCSLVPGKGVDFAPDNPLELVARTDGSVRLERQDAHDRVIVDNVYTVDKHVDYSTGNVVFRGAVRVKGDVLPGFEVKATGDVQIGGFVERGAVEAGGSVLVLGGILGAKGQGLVKAQGNVAARFVNGATVVAGGDIVVRDEAINSLLEAGGSVVLGMARSDRGTMIGGRAKALKSIRIQEVGSAAATTRLELVGEESNRGALAEIKERIEGLQGSLQDLDTQLKTMVRNRASGKDQTTRNAAAIQKLSDTYNQLLQQFELSKREEERLEALVRMEKEPAIVVLGTLHPGTEVTIGSRSRRFEEAYSHVELVSSDDDSGILALGLPGP